MSFRGMGQYNPGWTLQTGTGVSRKTINDFDVRVPYRSFKDSLVYENTFAMNKNQIPSGLLEGGQNALLTGPGPDSYFKVPYSNTLGSS